MFIIEHLVGLALAGLASDITAHIAGHDALTVEQARRLETELTAMAGRFPIEQAIHRERFMPLGFLQRPFAFVDNNGSSSGLGLRGGAPAENLTAALDRNRAMRRVNRWYDRLVDAASAETRAERISRFAQLDADFEELEQRLDSQTRLLWVPIAPRTTITDSITDLLLAVMFPALERASETVDRAVVVERMEIAALAVAGYRAEHGEYPESLERLTGGWLDTVPVDIFREDGGPIRYRVEENRVVLYSVGQNGEDDGGAEGERRDEGDLVLEWSR